MTVSKVVFRIPPTAHLAPLLIAVAATPFAFAAPGLYAIYLVPILIVVWVLRNRTTADATGVTARGWVSSQSLQWDQIASLKLDRGRVSAVGTDGTVTRLPGVRLRHLSLLSSVSNGRVPDPADSGTANPDGADTDTADENTPEETPATPDTSPQPPHKTETQAAGEAAERG